MEDKGKTQEKVKLALKYKRSTKLIDVKMYVRQLPSGTYEALLESDMASRNKDGYVEESVTLMRTWFDLEQALQRSSTVLGMYDRSLYTRLLLLYCVKGCSFIPKEQWQTEKDDIGVERMVPSFADQLFGEDGLPLEIIDTIVRAVNMRL